MLNLSSTVFSSFTHPSASWNRLPAPLSDSYLVSAATTLIRESSFSRILFTMSLDSLYNPSSSQSGSFPTNTKVLSPKANQFLMLSITSSLVASSSGVMINANPTSLGISISEKPILLNGILSGAK